jgi:serine/threonine protein kinase
MREGHSPDVNAICRIYPDLMPELEEALRGLTGDSGEISPPDTTRTFMERPVSGAVQSPCLSPAQQQGVLQGTLSSEDQPRVEEHLRTCDACRRELKERREFERLLLDYDRFEQGEAFFPAITVPSHEIVRWIGRGGTGDVWLARHVVIDEERAIKTIALSPRDPSEQERLSQEAKIIGILDRPRRNRVIVHDCYVDKGYLAIIMEYVSGGSLSCHTSPETPMPWDRACKYIAGVAEGLLDVHHRGVLHRDIKPSNILLDETHDDALLGDFGLAAMVAEANAIVGTPGYIAPELLTGGATTKSDVFSLAATLFHLVAGHRPFAADNVMASLALAAAGLPSPVPALRNVPWAVEEVILAGLEPKPAMRPDLKTFRARLRGARHQSLADHLRGLGSRSPVKLKVAVFTAKERQHIDRPVACLATPREPHRNPELVPEPSLRATLTTGDWVRFEAKADTDGYLTVLSFSASGEKVQLFPSSPDADNRMPANQPQKVTIQLTAPAGTDQAVFLWTRHKESSTVEAWRKRIEAAGGVTVSPGESSRGMQLLLHEVGEEPPDAWTAQVVTIVHQEPVASDASGGDTSLAPPVRGGRCEGGP